MVAAVASDTMLTPQEMSAISARCFSTSMLRSEQFGAHWFSMSLRRAAFEMPQAPPLSAAAMPMPPNTYVATGTGRAGSTADVGAAGAVVSGSGVVRGDVNLT